MEWESAPSQDLSHEMLRRSVDNILLHLPAPKRERALTLPIITEHRNVYKCIKGNVKFTKYEEKRIMSSCFKSKDTSPERFSVSPIKVPEELQENIDIKLSQSLWVAATACSPSVYFADRRPADTRPRRKRTYSVHSMEYMIRQKYMRMDDSEKEEMLGNHVISNRHSFPESLEVKIKKMEVDFSNLCTNNNSSSDDMIISDTLTERAGDISDLYAYN